MRAPTPEPPDLKATQEHYKMAVFLELFAVKKRESRAKKSNAGRKKTAWYRIKLTASGRDSWVQLRPDVVADLVGVSKQTVYHWIAGTKTPAPTTQALLEIVGGGSMPWRAWKDWRVCTDTGRMIAPNGYSFNAGELSWWSLQKALNDELRRENLDLKIQLETMRAQVNEQAINNLLPFRRRIS